MRAALSWVLYPSLVGSAIFSVYFSFSRGVAPTLALLVLQVVMMLVVSLLERLLPEHASWNVPREDVATDALYLLVSGLCVSGLVRALTFGAAPSLGLWPTRWPLAAQVALAVGAADLASYATHVLTHRVGWLFPIHAPHHSAERLYWLNATRMHPLDQGSTVLLSLLPLALLGAPAKTLALFDAFAIAHIMLQHSNVRLRHGVLSRVIATAEVHRWHHSAVRAESECNYATFVSLWDHLFGTFRMPANQSPPEDVGLYDGVKLPTSFLGQLRSPFRAWRKRLG